MAEPLHTSPPRTTYQRFDVGVPDRTHGDDRLTGRRIAGAIGVVLFWCAATFGLLAGALVTAMSGFMSNSGSGDGGAILLLVLAALAFLATSTAGIVIRRWWAWATPVWIVGAVACGSLVFG
jgi:hypothetical protein